MKKILLASTLLAMSATSALAQINVDVDLGGREYVEPRPVYVQHTTYYHENGRDRHRHNYDWSYWDKDRHDDDHHDNGHHYGQYKHK